MLNKATHWQGRAASGRCSRMQVHALQHIASARAHAAMFTGHQARRESYVHMHYTNAAGKPAVLRATAGHLMYAAGQAIPPTATAAILPPGAVTKRADAVAVGDLLAVQSPDGASFYTAEVTRITRWVQACALWCCAWIRQRSSAMPPTVTKRACVKAHLLAWCQSPRLNANPPFAGGLPPACSPRC